MILVVRAQPHTCAGAGHFCLCTRKHTDTHLRPVLARPSAFRPAFGALGVEASGVRRGVQRVEAPVGHAVRAFCAAHAHGPGRVGRRLASPTLGCRRACKSHGARVQRRRRRQESAVVHQQFAHVHADRADAQRHVHRLVRVDDQRVDISAILARPAHSITQVAQARIDHEVRFTRLQKRLVPQLKWEVLRENQLRREQKSVQPVGPPAVALHINRVPKPLRLLAERQLSRLVELFELLLANTERGRPEIVLIRVEVDIDQLGVAGALFDAEQSGAAQPVAVLRCERRACDAARTPLVSVHVEPVEPAPEHGDGQLPAHVARC
eukprot:6213799-Pleurochrysis_carterae.AAC.6